MSTESPISIRIDLKGDLKDHFLTIKSHYGLRNNSETIRTLIKEKFREVKD
jgi:hypothetical protein